MTVDRSYGITNGGKSILGRNGSGTHVLIMSGSGPGTGEISAIPAPTRARASPDKYLRALYVTCNTKGQICQQALEMSACKRIFWSVTWAMIDNLLSE